MRAILTLSPQRIRINYICIDCPKEKKKEKKKRKKEKKKQHAHVAQTFTSFFITFCLAAAAFVVAAGIAAAVGTAAAAATSSAGLAGIAAAAACRAEIAALGRHLLPQRCQTCPSQVQDVAAAAAAAARRL